MTSNNETLVVLVRGWGDVGDFFVRRNYGGDFPQKFIDTIKGNIPNAKIIAPNLEMGVFSISEPKVLVNQILKNIDDAMEAGSFKSIILLGYSSGAPLVKRVVVEAWGVLEDSVDGVAVPRKVWAKKIDRVVYLAGITRGWSISSVTPWLQRLFLPILTSAMRAICFMKGGKPFLFNLKRGAPFIVSTAIKQINLLSKLKRQNSLNRLPQYVSLLGSIDEFISPADSIEVGLQGHIAYIEAPFSAHTSARAIWDDDPSSTTRRDYLIRSLIDDFENLDDIAIRPEDIDDYEDELDRPIINNMGQYQTIDHVVFVLHGIRDNGFWTKRVAREIKRHETENTLTIRAPSPSYGYFSALDFVKPVSRNDATYWFMDKYLQIKSYFPYAEISFVGHSNGSYLGCHSLNLCEEIKFRNLVLAGSVVRTDFPWHQHDDKFQKVLNFVATRDFVVSSLPGLFQRLRMSWLNVGGAGSLGFQNHVAMDIYSQEDLARNQYTGTTERGSHPAVYNFNYVIGGHSAAIKEPFWQHIAEFVRTGSLSDIDELNGKFVSAKRGIFTRLLHYLVPLAVLGSVSAISYVLFISLRSFGAEIATRPDQISYLPWFVPLLVAGVVVTTIIYLLKKA